MTSESLQFALVVQQVVMYAGGVSVATFLGLAAVAMFRRGAGQVR